MKEVAHETGGRKKTQINNSNNKKRKSLKQRIFIGLAKESFSFFCKIKKKFSFSPITYIDLGILSMSAISAIGF